MKKILITTIILIATVAYLGNCYADPTDWTTSSTKKYNYSGNTIYVVKTGFAPYSAPPIDTLFKTEKQNVGNDPIGRPNEWTQITGAGVGGTPTAPSAYLMSIEVSNTNGSVIGHGTVDILGGTMEEIEVGRGIYMLTFRATIVCDSPAAPPQYLMTVNGSISYNNQSNMPNPGQPNYRVEYGVSAPFIPEPATVISFLFGALGFAVKRFWR